jgi:hypothetical protein
MNTEHAGLVLIDPDLGDDERRQLLYSGALVMYSNVEAVHRLVAHARSWLAHLFGDVDPQQASDVFMPDEMADKMVDFKPRFIHDATSKQLLVEVCTELGCDPEMTFFDPVRLRTSFPSDHLTSGIAYAFGWHRDTWYTAPPAQINWWLPVYPLKPGNGLDLLPAKFGVEVPNNSADFNYYVHNSWRGKMREASNAKDARTHPETTAPVDGSGRIRLQPPVGGVLLFCGDQLHASVPNNSGLTRYSIDFRTVHRADVEQHLGGPGTDAVSHGTNLRDFMRMTDHERLPESLAREYEPADAHGDEVLLYEPTLGEPAH